MNPNVPFEVPQQLRDLAERNVEQARAAYVSRITQFEWTPPPYGQFMDAMEQATSIWLGSLPPNEAMSGFKVVQERAVRFAKQNAEACFTMASELASAKDIPDVFAIQSRFAQTQMQAYALQSQELGRLMVEAAQSMQFRL